MKTGIELIAEERRRQIEVEGWDAEHDAEHKNGELKDAAICYAEGKDYMEYSPPMNYPDKVYLRQNIWPWHHQWWKPSPKNRIRELAKAGALIAAEIDRLNRKRAQPKDEPNAG
jgi:hypothetical protein